jgi:uncharacterized protein
MSKIVDTNLLIRYLTGDDKEKADQVEKLFRTSKEKLALPDLVIAEIIWVLTSTYKLSKVEVITKIESILSLDVLEADKKLNKAALENYKDHNINWIDAYIAALVQTNKHEGIYSYDRDFRKIPNIRWVEPKTKD